jgi:hypothetical protein
MSAPGELNEFLSAWEARVNTKLKEYRDCMTLVDHDDRLKKLLAASSELERYRQTLEERLRAEKGSQDHKDEAQRIQGILQQSKEISEATRDLLMLVSMIVGQQKGASAEQRSYASLKEDSKALVQPVNDVENKMQELLDSSNGLSQRLGGNGPPMAGVSRQADAAADAESDQEEESA